MSPVATWLVLNGPTPPNALQYWKIYNIVLAKIGYNNRQPLLTFRPEEMILLSR